MAMRIRLRVMLIMMLAAVLASSSLCAAQQAAPRSQDTSTKAPASPVGSKAKSAVDDAARKSEILASERWRRAMFELNEWLNAQQLFTPQQVAKIKADFSAKVARMNAEQLKFTLDDMYKKFEILQTPQAEDARAWLKRYLSILSEQKRKEVLSKLPNIGSMTAAQLQTQIAAILDRRAAMQRQEQQVQQLRDTGTNPWSQNTKMAEQAYVSDHTTPRSTYTSPYRGSPPGKRPFENVHTNPNMGFYVTPYGGVGMVFGGGF